MSVKIAALSKNQNIHSPVDSNQILVTLIYTCALSIYRDFKLSHVLKTRIEK